MRFFVQAASNPSQIGLLATCPAARPWSRKRTSTRPALKFLHRLRSPAKSSSSDLPRFPNPLRARVQDEGQRREKGKSTTIPIKSESDEKLVGAALAKVFQQYGSGSVACEDLGNLEKCYRALSVALSFLSPGVWVTFKEFGRLSQNPDKTVFRPLKFTLTNEWETEVLNAGYEEFQVTAKTKSQKLADAMGIILKQNKVVGLRSVGFSALLNSTNAVKKVRRDFKLSRDVLVVRPGVYNVKDETGSYFVERFEVACRRIAFYTDEIDTRESFGWKNAK